GGDVRLRVRRPRAHLVRVLPGILLDRAGGAPIRVPFPQHGVHGAPEHLRVARLDRLLGRSRRILRIVRNLVALPLQLTDRRLELGARCAYFGQLDDVGLGALGQLAELGQPVGHSLGRGQVLGEIGEDSPGQGDVGGSVGEAGAAGNFGGVSMGMPGPAVNLRMIGRSEWVASAGASSISVQMIFPGSVGMLVLSPVPCPTAASLCGGAWHSIVTATGSDVMWQGYVSTWMPSAVVSPP